MCLFNAKKENKMTKKVIVILDKSVKGRKRFSINT